MKKRLSILGIASLCVCVATSGVFAQGIFDKVADWPQVGASKVAGSVSFANGVYTLEGNGDDIWGNADEGLYVYTTKSGSQSISARVNWVEPGANEWSKVGVMIREVGDDPGSKTYYSILRGYDYGDRADAAWRTTTGGSSGSVQMFVDPPDNTVAVQATADGLWLRVTRLAEANIMVAEWSEDGTNWNIGDITYNLSMADTAAYGLCITNHDDNTELVVADVDNVKISAPSIKLVLAKRILPTSVLPEGGGKVAGNKIKVDIIPSGSSSGTVTEAVPSGVTISNIKTTNGSASVTGGNLVWKLSNASGSAEMTYDMDISATAAAPGFVLLSGTIDSDGKQSAISGVDSLFKVQWQAPFIDREVTLDGVIAAGEYTGARTETFGHASGDTTPPGVHIDGTAYPADKENVEFHIYHSRTSIYVGMTVLDGDVLDFDPDPVDAWQHDSAEIYLDGNLNRLETKENARFGPQMTVLGDGSVAAGNDAPTPVELPNGGYAGTNGAYWNYGAKAYPTDNKYVVEYQMLKDQMLDPVDRTVVGFDILMNSGSGTHARTGKWGYNTTRLDGTAGEYWNDETGWIVIELAGGPTNVSEWYLY